jgi:outer membrane receptor for monomeric catechols
VLEYEAGFKAALFGRSVQLNGAAYHSEYKDKQVLGEIDAEYLGEVAALTNIPRAEVYGGEFQILAAPFKGFTLGASGSFTQSKILGDYTTTNVLGKIQDFEGTMLPYAPRWQLAANARYEWPLSNKINGFVGTNVTHQSVTNGEIGDPSVTEIRPYTLTDLQAGIQSSDGRWRTYLWGRNIFDIYYWSTAVRITDTYVRWAGMPATFGVTFSYNYR